MVKNRAVVAKKGPKTKKSLLNPLIRELYKVTGKILSGIFCLNFRLADIKKETSFEEIVKLGDIIEGKEGSFLAPSYNVNRVDAANELIAHLRTQVGSSKACLILTIKHREMLSVMFEPFKLKMDLVWWPPSLLKKPKA